MIIRSMKKVLSSIVIAAYLLVYTAPIGFCATTIPSSLPKINAAIQKPVLRSPIQSSSLKLEGDIALTKGNPKISLSLRDSDVEQVLRMFADKAGLNIVFHSSVTGKVTLDLVNVPLNEAFKLVMQITDLTYFVDNNTMVVASSSAAKSLNLAKQDLTVIPVKYVDAAVLADFLNKNIFSINKPGLSNTNIAVTNPGTNEILIFGTKNDFIMAKKIVAQFDVKPRNETFVVNHTTPKEMSDLICKTLFQSFNGTGSSSGGTSNSGGSSSAASSSQAGGTPASAPAQGKPTGGAADSSSSSSSGGGGGGSSSGMALGGGVVACQYNNSVSADKLSSLSGNNLTLTYFPQRGTLEVLGGSAQQIEMIKDFISRNDKKEPQAYLELSIIELTEDGSRTFNNNWKVWSSFFSGSFDGTTATNPIVPNFFGDGTSYNVVDSTATDPTKVLYTISKFAGSPMATYSMNYLIQNGKGRVLANPKILITNGVNSTVDLTSDYVSKIDATTNTSAAGNVTTYTYTIASDDGIKVDITTPYISPDGYVTLNIKPNYATIKEQVPGFGTTAKIIVATLLQRRNLDLKNIRIKDGETLTIGGMIQETEQKNVAKVPVLGDLPGVGMFFRNTSTTKSKQELVIMITPKILKDTEDVVTNTGATL